MHSIGILNGAWVYLCVSMMEAYMLFLVSFWQFLYIMKKCDI